MTYPPNQIKIAESHKMAYEQAYALLEDRYSNKIRKLKKELRTAKERIKFLTKTK